MAIPKTIIGVEVQGADKAAAELGKVSKANVQLEKTARDAKSVDGLSKKFDELSGSVGKGLSKLNDIGDMFKIVGVFAGGAAFGGLADILDAFSSLSSQLGITQAATSSWATATGVMSEGMAKAVTGLDNLTEHINIYVKSIGLASEAELTWSQKQEALRNIAKGKIQTREQLEGTATSMARIGFVTSLAADFQDALGLDSSKNRAVSKTSQILENQAQDMVTRNALSKRGEAALEKQVKFYEDWVRGFEGKGRPAGGVARVIEKTTAEIVADVFAAPGSGRLSMQQGVLAGISDQLAPKVDVEKLQEYEELDAAMRAVGKTALAEYQAFAQSAPESFAPGRVGVAFLDARATRLRRAAEVEQARYNEAQAVPNGDLYTAESAYNAYGQRIMDVSSAFASPAQKFQILDSAAAAADAGDIEGLVKAFDGLFDSIQRVKDLNAETWANMEFSVSSAFSGMISSALDLGSVLVSTVGVFTNAIGSMMTNMILSGESGGKAILKTMGNAIAGVSAQAFSYSILLAALGTAAVLSGPILGFEAPGLFAGAAVMATAGTVLGGTARLMGANKLGQGASSPSGGGGGGGTALSNPYSAQGGDTKVTVVIGGEVVTRGVKTETRRQNLRGGISEGRMAMAT